MSCDFLVLSEAGVILSQTHKDSAEIKTSSSGAGNIMPASYVTGQLSHLTTDVSHSWVV